MDTEKDVRLYRSYLLPPQFSAAIQELRSYLLHGDDYVRVEMVVSPSASDDTTKAVVTLWSCMVELALDQDWIGFSGQ